MKTAEECLEHRISPDYLNKEGAWLVEPILKAMEEYASQFKPVTSERVVTDEEIKIEAKKQYPVRLVNSISKGRGVHKQDLNEEKRFAFHEGAQFALSLPSNSRAVAEVEFAEWAGKNGWVYNSFWKSWSIPSNPLVGEKSTSELYQIFLSETLKPLPQPPKEGKD